MPTLQQFRYLVAVADTLHFRRAAELCHVTQPTLSGQLRELEEKLGVQLVERSRARVIMTPVGKEIAARSRTVLREVQNIVELAKHGQDLLGGTIRVGVLQSVGPYLLPNILPALHKAYPQLRLHVREGLPQSLLHGLDDGTFDLLLFPLPVQAADLEVVRLFREPLLIVAPNDHRLAAKETVARSDLKGERILTLEPGHRLYDQVRALSEEYGAELALDYEGTSLDTLRQMVSMGMGVSFLPALYVRSEVRNDDQVVARGIRGNTPYRMIGMVWRRHTGNQDQYAALADTIRKILKKSVPEITVMK